MNALPSLAVVIPNHNHGHLIGAQLRSIFEQSVRPQEIIIIDDGSTDDSVERIRKLVSGRGEVQLICHATNAGANARVNEAIRLARADYLAFQSADDEVLPGFFQKSLELLARFPAAALCSAITRAKHPTGSWTVPPIGLMPTREAGYIEPLRVHELLLHMDSWIMSNTAVVRREFLVKAGGFDPRLMSATDEFMWRVLALERGACFVPEVLALNHQDDSSFSRTTMRNEQNMLQIMTAIDLRMRELPTLFSKKLVLRTNLRMVFRALAAIADSFAPRVHRVLNATYIGHLGRWLIPLSSAVARTFKVAALVLLRPYDVPELVRARLASALARSRH